MREAGVVVEVMQGDEIPDEIFPEMFRFYLSTIDRHVYGRQYLGERFFELVRERFRERLCFVVARDAGRPIAGTFNVQKGDALYGRYWGCLQRARNLHFDLCYYAPIEHCIERGLARFEAGAGGDYKQVRGLDAQPTWSVHKLVDPRLADAIERYLERERADYDEAIGWLQEKSALKKTGGETTSGEKTGGEETGGLASETAGGGATAPAGGGRGPEA